MKRLVQHSVLLVVVTALMCAFTAGQASAQTATSTKKERNYINKGNKLYNDKRYAEAEVEYKKALQENPQSAVATFNLATTLLRQGNGTAAQDDENNPANRAEALLHNLVKSTADRNLIAKAYYDLGNIAYSRQQYDEAIDHYKNALRRNPDDEQARKNLRLAQIKKKEQDKQNQNQDKNQDKNQDQNKDKDKEQNKDKDQNKDQDKNKDKNQDQNKGDQDKGDQGKDDKANPQQGKGNMSKQNMEQILKTMQDKENATQQRVQAVQAKQQQRERARTSNKW